MVFSKESKEKLSKRMKEKWANPEFRKNQSIKHLGKKHSEEKRKKITKSLIGREKSIETRKKMSDAQKGIPCPQRGNTKPRSEYQKQRIRESLAKLGKKKLSERAKKTHTPESKIKRQKSFQEHKRIILESAEKFRKEGYEVVTEFDLRPDLIIRKKNKIIAVEVQRGKPKDNYENQKVFDEVKWILI